MAKVVAVHHWSGLGGGSIGFIDVVMSLRTEHEVTVICADHPGYLRDEMMKNDIDVVAPPSHFPIYAHFNGSSPIGFLRGLLGAPRNLIRWRSALRKRDMDILVVNSAVLVLLGWTLRGTGVATVCYVRETFPRRSVRTTLLRAMLDRWFSSVLFLTEYDRKRMGLVRARTYVVPEAVRDRDLVPVGYDLARSQLLIPTGSTCFLFCGGDSWIKGLDVLLRAAALTTDTPVFILVSGAVRPSIGRRMGGLRWHVRDEIRSLVSRDVRAFERRLRSALDDPRIEGRFRLVGEIQDMSLCYEAADVVVWPATVPHQGRPIYEAGWFDLPVLVSDFPCTEEAVQAGHNGMVFSPGDVGALADLLRDAVNRRPYYEDLGRTNGDWSRDKHGFDNLANALNRVAADASDLRSRR